MARQMVVNYGFSDIGPWSLLDQGAQSPDMIMRMMAKSGTSESLQMKIDNAVRFLYAAVPLGCTLFVSFVSAISKLPSTGVSGLPWSARQQGWDAKQSELLQAD